jgi:D-threo-aldose 1-dehydrogenase
MSAGVHSAGARRKFRRGALEVSALGLGGWALGNFDFSFPDTAANSIVESAYSRGIQLFDTAPGYGRGLSEHRVGHVLRSLPRESYVISTKVGKYLIPDPTGTEARAGLRMKAIVDYSRDGTLRSLDQSMQRLGIGRIDIVLIHDLDIRAHKTSEAYQARFREAMEGAYPVLHDLRAQGIVRAIGVGVNEVRPCLDVLAAADPDCLMLAGRYSLLDHSVALTELLPECERRDVSLLIAGAYNSGTELCT